MLVVSGPTGMPVPLATEVEMLALPVPEVPSVTPVALLKVAVRMVDPPKGTGFRLAVKPS